MDLEIIIISEASQRQISYDITYMWNLKMIQMNLFTKRNRLTDLEKELLVISRKGHGGG